MTETLTRPAAAARRGRLTELATGTGYALTGFPIATAAFVLLVTGVSLAAGTVVIVIGFGVAALTLGIARAFAALERIRLEAVLGRRLPRPAYRPLRPGPLGAVLSAGSDPRRWLDLVHGIVAFPVAVASFAVVVSWWATALGGLTSVFWQWSVPHGPDRQGLADVTGFGDGLVAEVVLVTALGLVAALTLPLVVRFCVALQAGVAHALLVGHQDDAG